MAERDVVLNTRLGTDAFKQIGKSAQEAEKHVRSLAAAMGGVGGLNAPGYNTSIGGGGPGRTSGGSAPASASRGGGPGGGGETIGRETNRRLANIESILERIARSGRMTGGSGGGGGPRGPSAARNVANKSDARALKIGAMGVAAHQFGEAGGALADEFGNKRLGAASRAAGNIAGGAAVGFATGGAPGAIMGAAAGAAASIGDLVLAIDGIDQEALKAEESLARMAIAFKGTREGMALTAGKMAGAQYRDQESGRALDARTHRSAFGATATERIQDQMQFLGGTGGLSPAAERLAQTDRARGGQGLGGDLTTFTPGSDRAKAASGLATEQAGLAGDVLNDLVKQRDLRMEMRQIELDTSNARLAGLNQEYSSIQKAIELEKTRRDSAAGQFGDASPFQQKRLKEIAEKHKRGETLTKAETGLAGQFDVTREIADKARTARGRAAGFEDVASVSGFKDRTDDLKRQGQDIQGLINVANEYNLKIEVQAKADMEELRPLIENWIKEKKTRDAVKEKAGAVATS